MSVSYPKIILRAIDVFGARLENPIVPDPSVVKALFALPSEVGKVRAVTKP
tara:strand:- start:58 stop:210 length:153 start_codon:yes stop_codon:yes gene_type:complete